jgi:bacteriocin-like protein
MKEQNRANLEAKIAGSQHLEENELSDQELDEVSGGITPIPIPELDLSRYLQKPLQPNLNPNLKPKGFDPGGGI